MEKISRFFILLIIFFLGNHLLFQFFSLTFFSSSSFPLPRFLTEYFPWQKGKLNFYRTKKGQDFVLSEKNFSKSVNIISQVGEYHLTIEGYTSPFALVELSTGLFTVTEMRTADSTGYFKFENILLHSWLSKEPCLIATDKNKISTPPLCLSEIPRGKDIFITGIILAPSLLLEKGESEAKKTIIASGYTTPNSEVNLYLFREEKERITISFIKKAQAKEAPKFSLKSNSLGYFEFNLPSYLPTKYRLFVASRFLEAYSPKSHTLSFRVLTFFEKVFLSIYNLLYLLTSFFRNFLSNPLFLIFLEIGIIILLLFFLKKKREKRHLALIKYPEVRVKKYKEEEVTKI